MQLFRVFPWDGHSRGNAEGGPLYVPRHKQGAGRHDIPEREGVIYCSKVAVSAVAETLKPFRGQTVPRRIFSRPDGTVVALATLELEDSITLVDLDDTAQLSFLGFAPSEASSTHRAITQAVARKLFDQKHPGFIWWSALKSSWKNATLFESRVSSYLKVSDIVNLGADLTIVNQIADEMFVKIGPRG
jgi:hypothetical protein